MASQLQALLPALREVARAEGLLLDEDETSLVRALQECWPSLAAAVSSRWAALETSFDRLPSDDPLFMEETLLGVVDGAERETLHTQVLGRLLAPSRSRDGVAVANPLAMPLLSALVAATGAHIPVIDDRFARVRVESVLDGAQDGRRLDLLVEIGEPCEHRLVIENKIRARAGDGQLPAYAAWARRSALPTTLIFLSPAPPRRGDGSDGWIHLSYGDLASAFRRVLSEAADSVWRQLLRLYLGTIVQDVLVYPRTRERVARTDTPAFLEYLHAAAGPE